MLQLQLQLSCRQRWGYGTQHSLPFQFAANDTQSKFFVILVTLKYAEGPRTYEIEMEMKSEESGCSAGEATPAALPPPIAEDLRSAI